MVPRKNPKKEGKKTGNITKERKEQTRREAVSASKSTAADEKTSKTKTSQEEAKTTYISTSESTAVSTQTLNLARTLHGQIFSVNILPQNIAIITSDFVNLKAGPKEEYIHLLLNYLIFPSIHTLTAKLPAY